MPLAQVASILEPAVDLLLAGLSPAVSVLPIGALILVPIGLALVIGAAVYPLFTPTDYTAPASLRPGTASPPRPRRIPAADLPPPYPNGWFDLCLGRTLKCGEVKDVSCLGLDLLVFREQKTGKVHVLDKYCPHLGANIAVGGKVVQGDCVECPFHGWQFKGDSGECVNVPYSEEGALPREKLRRYHCVESLGMILLWHHANPDAEPEWYPPCHEGVDSGSWTFHGRSEHMIACHIQEIPENGADVAHLNVLHPPFMYSLGSSVFSHHFEAQWSVHKELAHMSHVNVSQSLKLWGHTVPGTSVPVVVHQTAGFVMETFTLPGLGKVIIVESITPVRVLLQRASHYVYAEWWVPRFVAKFVLKGLIVQFERDVMIWNEKVFRAKPALVKEEKAIAPFRRWYKQFYSETSLSFAEAVERERGVQW